MADKGNRGSGSSFRQDGRKRREPPIIDAAATDLSETQPATDDRADPVEAGVPASIGPEQSGPGREGTTAGAGINEEPVLFGNALRDPNSSVDVAAPSGGFETAGGAPPATAEEPAAATQHVRTADLGPGPATSTMSERPFRDEPGAADRPSPASNLGSGLPPTTSRSWATRLLGLTTLALLCAIAVLLYTEPRRTGSDELRANLESTANRVATLESRPDASKLAPQVDDLSRRVTEASGAIPALRASLDDLANQLKQLQPQVGDNAAKVASLEQALAAQATRSEAARAAAPAEPAPSAQAPTGELSGLVARVDDIEHRMASLPADSSPAAPDLGPMEARVSGLTQRLDALQAAVAALPKVDLRPLEQRAEAAERQMGDIDRKVETLGGTVAALPRPDLAPLRAGITAIEQRLAPVEAALATPKSGERATEARAVGSAALSQAAPLAVVAASATRAIDEGRPFEPEIDALKSLGVSDAALAPLGAVAAKGAPTLASLKAQWEDLQPEVVAATRPESHGGVLGRLAAGARQIVRIRPVGASPGDDPAAIGSRIGAALDRGDLADALAEWAKLPEPGQKASEGWADAARARMEAEAAAQALTSQAINTFAKAKG